jgi:hypothetical protein
MHNMLQFAMLLAITVGAHATLISPQLCEQLKISLHKPELECAALKEFALLPRMEQNATGTSSSAAFSSLMSFFLIPTSSKAVPCGTQNPNMPPIASPPATSTTGGVTTVVITKTVVVSPPATQIANAEDARMFSLFSMPSSKPVTITGAQNPHMPPIATPTSTTGGVTTVVFTKIVVVSPPATQIANAEAESGVKMLNTDLGTAALAVLAVVVMNGLIRVPGKQREED